MAVQNAVETIPFLAGADLSGTATQYRFVKISANNTVVLASGATDEIVGVLQNRPKQNQGATVAMDGRLKVVAGAALVIGDRVTSDSAGRAIATTTAGNSSFGVVVHSAANANELAEIEVQPAII